MIDLGLAFSFPFADKDWFKKLIIPGLIGLIPLIGQIAFYGWWVEVTRRVIRQQPDPLPDFSDFAGYLTDGLKGIVISLGLALPIILFSIPLVVASAFADSSEGQTVLAILGICFACFTLPYSLLLALAVPASIGQLATTGRIGEAIHPRKLLGLIRAAPGAYLLTILGTMVGGFIASAGILLCGVGVIFTGAYAYAIQGHLYGQAHRAATTAGAAV